MYSPPSSPLSIGGVIDDGLRLFANAFSRCWPLAVAPGLLAALYEITFPFNLPTPGGHPSPAQALQALAAAFSLRAGILDLVIFVLSLVFQGAVIVREIAIVRGDDSITLGRALGVSLQRFPGLLLGSILFAFTIAAGTIALIIPGVWLWGRLLLWMVALFLEDASATDALASSWRLTRGNWWRAAVIFTVGIIIVVVLTMVFTFVAGLVAGLAHLTTQGRLLALQLSSLITNAISYPLGVAILLAMYNDLKLRREGGDLASRARALGAT
jgi:hypothetical protein